MHNLCLDDPLNKWFDFKVPKTSVSPDYIKNALMEDEIISFKPTAKIVWLGKEPVTESFTQSKKGRHREMSSLAFIGKQNQQQIQLQKDQADWFIEMLKSLSVNNLKTCTLAEVKQSYEAAGLEDFELFWDNKPISTMNKLGLLRL